MMAVCRFCDWLNKLAFVRVGFSFLILMIPLKLMKGWALLALELPNSKGLHLRSESFHTDTRSFSGEPLKEAAGGYRMTGTTNPTQTREFRLFVQKFRWFGALMEHVSNHHLCNESANLLCLLAPCWLMLNCLEMKWLKPLNPSLQNFTFTQLIVKFFWLYYAHILHYITSSAWIPFPCTNTIYSV